MAPSSNNEHHSGEQRPSRLVRQDSSFIGTIKNIVKLPLNWFVNQDDAGTTTPGKRRRRLEQEPTEASIPEQDDVAMRDYVKGVESDYDSFRHSKRMRVNSPPKRTTQPYLDPPTPSHRRADPPRRASVVPRASSAVLPSSRATLSPRRRFPVVRTMSIDPPHQSLVRRESSAFDFGAPPASAEADYEMTIETFRDASMPSSPRRSPRPSFRMRASATPQPQQPPTRYISEPPPLNTLASNPVFLHAPTQPTQHAPPTLGALVESVRAAKSPTRKQHGSLFLDSNGNAIDNENKDTSERALHQLDIYKTPLLPTRMRSSNLPASITATTTPDMFKSRRKSNLILMQDDKDNFNRKVSGSGKSPVVNQTKPYAGEGGMKKLLARRKQEVEEEDIELKGKDELVNDHTPHAHHSPTAPVHNILELPISTGADWFSTAASTSSIPSGSSLRVGRAMNRNHLARPARSKFSAKYDEEADADDMEDERAEKRREMAKEAAKLVPLFKEPPGFSFSLEAPPMEASKDDNPEMFPISSLPFSITKSSVPSKPSPRPSIQPLAAEHKGSQPTTQASSTFGVLPDSKRVPTPEPTLTAPLTVPSLPLPVQPGGGPPNFFANSKLLNEVKLPVPPPMINFGLAPASTSATPSFSFAPSTTATISKPVNESENPFWDGGGKAPEVESKAARNLFGDFGRKDDNSIGSNSIADKSKPLFGNTVSAFAPIVKSKPEDVFPIPATQESFSFAEPAKTQSAFGNLSTPSDEQPKQFFGLPAPKTQETAKAPKPSFDDISKTQPSSSNSFEPSGVSQPTPPSLPFTFGPASTTHSSTPAPATKPSFFNIAAHTQPSDTSKSSFASSSGSGFSFSQASAEKTELKAPFFFNTTPSAPPISTSSTKATSTPFSFGQPSTTPAAPPLAFSFSGGGSATSDISSKPLFAFGQPSVQPTERPLTPPKIENEFRMEESPTRELQQVNNKLPELRPTIGGGGFSFGNPSPPSGAFGAQTVTAPFSFGPTPSNPFSKENKPEGPKGFSGFGQAVAPSAPSISTSFSFGQAKPAEDNSRPSSGSSFTFGATPASATAGPGTAFAFGTPASNPFGQPVASGSAPSSPSTFNQPSPFSFGAPAPTNSGFSFGSQPASPAAGSNLALPSSGFGAAGGFSQSHQPSSPFSAPIALAPSTSGGGGSLFTIGSAPAPAPGGPRAIKKLPNRRAGAKR